MKNTVHENSDSLPFLPAHVCAGFCAGKDWRLLDHNEAFLCFLSDHGKKDASGKESLAGHSLLSLLEDLEAQEAVKSILASQERKTAGFSFKRRRYAFAWSLLPLPAPRPDAPTLLRFFFFHELPEARIAEIDRSMINREVQAIIDSLHDGIWVIDGDGRTLHVNKSLKRIADIDARDVVGKHVSIPMQEGKFKSCVTLMALEQKKAVTVFDDYSCGTRCLNTSTPIFDEDGNIWRVVASIRDMTELERLQKRLAEAERTAHLYKGKLASLEKNQTSGFIANSKIMRACVRELEKAAKAPSGILILGETGTGKTFASSIIHHKSPRANGPFIAVNCAAIAPTLIESELFGYEKGAFTGASASGKKGFFELAHKGTLLLDEIGELPLNMQAKLLHVLDNQTFHRIGGEQSIKVDMRVIAATNKPLEQLVSQGAFRADLYYRLRVLSVTIPPLREHPEDIPELAMTFLDEACKRHGMVKTLSPKLLKCFTSHTWPGNVRELRAAIEFLAAMTEGSIIRQSDLPPYLMGSNTSESQEGEDEGRQGLRQAVNTLERSMIRAALARTGSTYKAAAELGVSQSTVVRKARQLGITFAE